MATYNQTDMEDVCLPSSFLVTFEKTRNPLDDSFEVHIRAYSLGKIDVPIQVGMIQKSRRFSAALFNMFRGDPISLVRTEIARDVADVAMNMDSYGNGTYQLVPNTRVAALERAATAAHKHASRWKRLAKRLLQQQKDDQ